MTAMFFLAKLYLLTTNVLRALVIILVCLCSFETYAQLNWLHKDGGLNHDESLGLAQDNNGNLIATGYFNSSVFFGNTLLVSSGFSDVFVHKSNSQGVSQWAIKLGGASQDRGTCISTDQSGNIYVSGYFTNVATFGGVTLTAPDVNSAQGFVTKISSSGNVLWAIQFGGTEDEFAYDIDIDVNSNVLMTGQFRGTSTFGSSTFSSELDPDTSEPGMDIFISKLNSSGTFLWTKVGAAPDDDRGMGITSDLNGNVYTTGQFSDTITFDNVYTNQVMNAGFILKHSPGGNEEWLVRLGASFTQPNDIQCDAAGNPIVVGDYTGQMAVYVNPIEFIPSTYDNNIFILKISTDGDFIWCSADGSINPVSCRALCIAEGYDLFITGTFQCVHSEYSEIWGPGRFNSVGYKDIYSCRFSANGQRIWERHFGSSKDDNAWGITPGSNTDKPVIAGSFEGKFCVPASDEFEDNSDIWTQSMYDYTIYVYPNYPGTQCNNDPSGVFQMLESEGAKDCFLINAINLDIEPYDYYHRSDPGDCSYPVEEPCIEISTIDDYTCPDTIYHCGAVYLEWVSYTGYQNFVGPGYDLEWNNGSTFESIYAAYTGWYWVESTTVDGCRNHVDSVYLVVNPIPVLTLETNCPDGYIIDNSGETIVTCGLPLILEAIATPGSIDDYSIFWNTGDTTSTITLTDDQYLAVTISDEIGCYDNIDLEVLFENPFQLGFQSELFYFQEEVSMDSIEICLFDELTFNLLNFIGQDAGTENLYMNLTVSLDGVEQMTYDSLPEYTSLVFTEDGLYNFEIQPFMPCCSGIVNYPVINNWVYIDVFSPEEINPEISGNEFICPGDTVTLTVTGMENATSYQWSFEGVASNFNQSTIEAFQPGYYTVTYTLVYGPQCDLQSQDYFLLTAFPQPLASTIPGNGVVCPGDSILLTVEDGSAYQWIGPQGQFLDNTQDMYVTTPGFYYNVQTNDEGCTLESNTVEVAEYNSPYLLAELGTDLCLFGYITVEVETNSWADITWMAPLSGNDTLMNIYETGEYEVMVDFCDIETSLTILIIETFVESEILFGDSILCPNDTIVLYANPGMNSYTWIPGQIEGDSLIVTSPGIYTLLTTDDQGCIGNSGNFQLLGIDDISLNPTTTEICLGDSTLLDTEGLLPTFWSSDSDGLLVIDSNAVMQTEALFHDTVYYVNIQDNWCGLGSTPFDVIINLSSLAPQIIADSAYCSSETITLYSQGYADFYQWTLPDSTVVVNDNLIMLNSDSTLTGWYYLMGMDNQCESELDSTYVVINDPLEIYLEELSELILCEEDTLILVANFPASVYVWQTPMGMVSDDDTLTISLGPEADGLYTVVLNGTVCENMFNSVFVEVITYPISTFAIENAQGCSPLLVSFDNNSTAENEVEYLWDFGDGSTSDLPNPSHFYLYPGIYNVSLTSISEEGCISEITLTDTSAVTVFVNPEAGFDVHPAIVDLFQDVAITDLSLGSTSCEYYIQGLGYEFDCDFEFSSQESGPIDIWQWVTNEFGCTDSASTQIFVSGFYFYAPNSFTPNQDGINDVWLPSVIGASYYDLQIFDRWGMPIFSTSNPSEPWTGNFQSGEYFVQNDVYIYHAIVQDGLGNTQDFTGHITIVR